MKFRIINLRTVYLRSMYEELRIYVQTITTLFSVFWPDLLDFFSEDFTHGITWHGLCLLYSKFLGSVTRVRVQKVLLPYSSLLIPFIRRLFFGSDVCCPSVLGLHKGPFHTVISPCFLVFLKIQNEIGHTRDPCGIH